MSLEDLSQTRKSGPIDALPALQRAAKRAREIAIATNTAIIIVRNGKTVRIPAEELRKEQEGS